MWRRCSGGGRSWNFTCHPITMCSWGVWEHMNLNFNTNLASELILHHQPQASVGLWPTLPFNNLHGSSTPTDPSNKLSGCIKVCMRVCVWVQWGVKVFSKVTLISESHCHFKILKTDQIATDWSHRSTSVPSSASITCTHPSPFAVVVLPLHTNWMCQARWPTFASSLCWQIGMVNKSPTIHRLVVNKYTRQKGS